ncbi:hypothetical protein BLOT_016780 [Blomia tropicalis]|nr:hypothetical protein BLOT_016780 [Blomia tropicalis]
MKHNTLSRSDHPSRQTIHGASPFFALRPPIMYGDILVSSSFSCDIILDCDRMANDELNLKKKCYRETILTTGMTVTNKHIDVGLLY